MSHYVGLDKVSATRPIESVVADFPIVNGQFLNLGANDVTFGSEAVSGTATPAGEKPDVLVASVFLDYGYSDFDILKQEVAVGDLARGYHVEAGMVVSVLSTDAAGLAVGTEVAVGAEGIGFKAAEADEVVIGTVIALEYRGNVGNLTVVRFK